MTEAEQTQPAKPAKKNKPVKKARPKPVVLPLPERIAKMRTQAEKFSALASKLTADADLLESSGDEKALVKKRKIEYYEKQIAALRSEDGEAVES